MPDNVTIEFTPRDFPRRLEGYSRQMDKVLKETNRASLLVIWEKVPPYPPKRPNQRYRRKGLLGKSLGVSMTGGQLGPPDIFQQKKLGTSGYEGAFGSALSYAGDVIGENQKPAFKGRWWTLKSVLKRATDKIVKLHNIAAEELARWLDGRG